MDTIKNLEQLSLMLKGSYQDIKSCEKDLQELENQNHQVEEKDSLKNFRKRNYVRTVFAYIDGVLFAMKRIILEDISFKTNIVKETNSGFVIEENESKLTPEDIIYLQEYKLEGPNVDNLKEVSMTKSFKANIKFTFRSYEKTRIENYETNFGCKEWKNFQDCIEIRNRITHPKKSQDLEITDAEFNNVKNSYEWFYKILSDLQKQEYN